MSHKLPGLIDCHVHIREPGAIHKGDWDTESRAALLGGITTILVMPNTNPEIVDEKTFYAVRNTATRKSLCYFGLFVGATEENADTVYELANKAVGLKMYLNDTYGPLLLQDKTKIETHLKNWPKNVPVCIHAEDKTLDEFLELAFPHNNKIHVCHVSKRSEIETVKRYKNAGMNLTCEVTPHHLFLTQDSDIPDWMKTVKPFLGTKDDQQALWDNLDIIDVFASDHAPHTIEDKKEGAPGIPGVSTMLSLLMSDSRLTIADIVLRLHTNPRKIFNIPKTPTHVIVGKTEREHGGHSKCGWSPYVVNDVVHEVRWSDGLVSDGQIVSYDVRDGRDIYSLPVFMNNVISIDQFVRHEIERIFRLTERIMLRSFRYQNRSENILGLMFMEPSTRTRCSFDAAMKRLGGNTVAYNKAFSSSLKGESDEDAVKTMSCYCDALVLRTPKKGLVEKVSKMIDIPIINAGDGTGEHPTQALLDGFTIKTKLGKISGLTIAMVGDLKHGRTVHSLTKLLSLFDIKLRFVSPASLKMPQEIKDTVKIEYTEHTTIAEVLPEVDVVYVTRVQKERFGSLEEYNKVKNAYYITPKLMEKAKKDMIVMHPLPRVCEISAEFDSDPRAAYFDQMKRGMYVRMALLHLIFRKVD